MYTLIFGSDRFTALSKIKEFEKLGYTYFHGDMDDFVCLLSSSGLFDNETSRKIIINFDTSKLDLNKKFLDTLTKFKPKNDIVCFYDGVLKSQKDLKSSFDKILFYSIKDNREIFSLIDAVFSKNEKKSLELTTQLLEKYDSFYILSMLFYQLKNILYSYYDIESFKNLHPYVSKKTNEISKNFSKVSAVSVLRAFSGLDYKLKSTNLGDDALYSVIYFVLSI